MVTKRAGLETFLDKLGSVSKSPCYSKAAQKPQLKYRKSDDLIFDYEFCKLFKSLEHIIIKVVQSKPNDPANGPEGNMSAEQHRLLTQYKDLIRVQDQELQVLRRDVHALNEYSTRLHGEYQELFSNCQQLRDQNSLLKAQKSAADETSLNPLACAEEGLSPQLIEDLRLQNQQLQSQLHDINEELTRVVNKKAACK